MGGPGVSASNERQEKEGYDHSLSIIHSLFQRRDLRKRHVGFALKWLVIYREMLMSEAFRNTEWFLPWQAQTGCPVVGGSTPGKVLFAG